MPEWVITACVLLLLVLFWPIKLCFGSSFLANRIRRKKGKEKKEGAPSLTHSDTRLICKQSALASYLLEHCVTFTDFSKPGFWLWRIFPSLQTLLNMICPLENKVRFIRDHLQLADEGLIALDWVVGPGSHKRRRTASNSSSPVLLIIPNSFGKITWNVLKLSELALLHGYHPVIFSRRGHNGCPLNTLKLQRFGDPSDLREAIKYIRFRYPVARLFAVSESTGSGLLLSYLGECGSSSYVTAAACISPVFRCQEWFDVGLPWLYHWILLVYQKVCLSRYATVLGEVLNMNAVLGCRSLKELEEALFCNTKKNAMSWDSYWEWNDPLRDVDEVAVPVLCICSQDDPIRSNPETTVPFELFETNPHFFLLLSKHGGHCGFFQDSTGSTALRSHEALLEFFHSTSDFFLMEEKNKILARRKGMGGSGTLAKLARGHGVNICKRESFCSHNIHDIYNWQRSYTR
ncbi:protein ABHD15-like [Protopterus annectens]|uniref:protein ABHD15-like n=1 Tax=Protopterus annectens TaxID=7888 RepID=UPI001CFB8AA8|nr:protein ABHD15-like [Protopterus annectens]